MEGVGVSQQSSQSPENAPGLATPLSPSPAALAQAEALEAYLASSAADLPHTLRPIAALREVVAICESIAGGRSAPRTADRHSLRADVQMALTAIGEELARELQPARNDFLGGELKALPDLLSETGGSARLGAAAVALIERLRSHAALGAAWRDLLDATGGGAVSIDDTRHLALVLREIDESLGYEWRWRRSAFRKLALEDQSAGARGPLVNTAPSTARTAWFVFADADLAADYLRIGQIQFFSHRLWPEAIADEDFSQGVEGAEAAIELDAEAVEQEFEVQDGSDARVYARVELSGPRAEPSRTPAAHGRPPAEWARELVSAVVDAGTFRTGGSAWRLLDGVSLYHGQISDGSGTFGSWSGSHPFVDPSKSERLRNFTNPLREGTGEALEALEPNFAELVAEDDAGASRAVEEVRWYEAARSQPDPAQRLVLHVRAFERALPVSARFHWNEAVRHYLRDFWAMDQFGNELFRLAYTTHSALRHQPGDPLQSLGDWLTDETGGRFSVALGAFMREAGAIYPKLPPSMRLERRRTKEVATWQRDQAEAMARIHLWGQRFSRLLARALRQRNATVHGVTTVPEVVASVDPFIARVASFVVAQTVVSAAEGSPLVEALERGRVDSRRTLWRLEQDDEASDKALFGAAGSGPAG